MGMRNFPNEVDHEDPNDDDDGTDDINGISLSNNRRPISGLSDPNGFDFDDDDHDYDYDDIDDIVSGLGVDGDL